MRSGEFSDESPSAQDAFPPPSPVGKGAGGLGLPWRAIGIVALVALVAVLALARAGELSSVWQALKGADPRWVCAAVLTQTLPYLALTRIYASLFSQQGYPQPLGLLARVATVVLTINRVLPTMGVTSSVYLVTTLRRRQIPEARILVVHTMEIVSYTVAFAIVTTWGLLVLVTRSAIEQVEILVPVVLAAGCGFFVLRWLRRRGLKPLVLRWAFAGNRVIGGILPIRALRITEERIERFINEMWHGARLAATRPDWFVRAVLWQLASLGGDCLTIACALAALGAPTHPNTIIIAFAGATALSAISFLPGGAGSFEAAMVVILVRRDIPFEAALAATLIFRGLTFWLPLALSPLLFARRERLQPSLL
ncbi:MAG: flippase-like domain-containing protein [Chloroflexota bacterium]|nr:flippase-like domain-containing protein [Chloroflexota bacterium]